MTIKGTHANGEVAAMEEQAMTAIDNDRKTRMKEELSHLVLARESQLRWKYEDYTRAVHWTTLALAVYSVVWDGSVLGEGLLPEGIRE